MEEEEKEEEERKESALLGISLLREISMRSEHAANTSDSHAKTADKNPNANSTTSNTARQRRRNRSRPSAVSTVLVPLLLG